MIKANSHIAAMAPYALACLSAPKGKRLLSLSQNESLRPPSSKAQQAIAHAARAAHLYPDPNWFDLRKVIAEEHGIDPDKIICGNGSLDLIGVLARAYLDPDTSAIVPAHAYPFFCSATQMTGARVDSIEESNLHIDVDALLSGVRVDTRIVFVANPGNPTGTRLPRAELVRLREGLRKDIILVIDEAYGEFADHLNEPTFDLVDRGDTLVLRTFSKAYGLAGLRVGWGYVPHAILSEMRKLLNPNNVALAGQLAATAAMRDQAYMRETCAQTAALRDAFIARMRGLGLHVPESYTNFVLIRFATSEVATAVDAYLKSEGVFLRPQGAAGLPNCLRATVGIADDMNTAATVIEDALKQGGGA